MSKHDNTKLAAIRSVLEVCNDPEITEASALAYILTVERSFQLDLSEFVDLYLDECPCNGCDTEDETLPFPIFPEALRGAIAWAEAHSAIHRAMGGH